MNCKLWIVNCKQITVHYSARIMNSELWTLIQLHSAVAGRQNNKFSVRRLCTSLCDLPSLISLTIFSRKCRGIRQRRTAAIARTLWPSVQKAIKFCQRFAFKNFPAICFQKAFKHFPAICFQKFSSDLLSKFFQRLAFKKLSKFFQRLACKNFPAISFQKVFKIFPAISFQKFSSD